MNVHRILNEFDKHYGKVHKKIKVYSFLGHIMMEVNYGKDENVMLKMWLKKSEPDYIKTIKPTYKLILFKDNVYINSYVMKGEENQKKFFEAYDKLISCKADYLVGSWDIDLSKKQLKQLYSDNQERIHRYANVLMKRNFFNQYRICKDSRSDYEEAIDTLPFHIDLEKYLIELMS